MSIHYLAGIREITNECELLWDKPEASVNDLLHDLADKYGECFKNWVLDGKKLHESVVVFINGREISYLNGLNTLLHPTDTITFASKVSL